MRMDLKKSVIQLSKGGREASYAARTLSQHRPGLDSLRSQDQR